MLFRITSLFIYLSLSTFPVVLFETPPPLPSPRPRDKLGIFDEGEGMLGIYGIATVMLAK